MMIDDDDEFPYQTIDLKFEAVKIIQENMLSSLL